MKPQDIIPLYEAKKQIYGSDTYRHITELLEEAKAQHKKAFTGKDFEQSWKPLKGKSLEKLVEHIIVDEVHSLGLEVINGNLLERASGAKLGVALSKVKRNLLIDYGEFGSHLPDVDIIIYSPQDYEVIAVLSVKTTLRERIAQTGYWKLKLSLDAVTEHIKVYFVTPDEDKTLKTINPPKKPRAIVEVDLDGSYVLNDDAIEESTKVKTFDKLIDDLRAIIK